MAYKHNGTWLYKAELRIRAHTTNKKKPSVHVKSAYLVQPSSEIDNDFPGSVVIDDLKLTNVTYSIEATR